MDFLSPGHLVVIGVVTLSDCRRGRRATSQHAVEDLNDQVAAVVEPAQPVTAAH